ncbi:MAG: hypothetical protein IIB14_04740 [Chloroflexi bacterium]|nr:hypothetical protein [Chloroflexota bacterium]
MRDFLQRFRAQPGLLAVLACVLGLGLLLGSAWMIRVISGGQSVAQTLAPEPVIRVRIMRDVAEVVIGEPPQIKVGLVALIIVLSAIHGFVLGPRIVGALERARSGGGEPSRGLVRGRLGLVWLARFNLLLVLAIVALAIVMTRGFPA